MKAGISIDLEGDGLAVAVDAYANCAVLSLGDLHVSMSSAQFDLLLKEMRRWILEDDE